MLTIELDGGGRGGAPLAGPLGALLVVRGAGDQAGQLGRAGVQQDAGVGVAFEDRQVGFAEVAG